PPAPVRALPPPTRDVARLRALPGAWPAASPARRRARARGAWVGLARGGSCPASYTILLGVYNTGHFVLLSSHERRLPWTLDRRSIPRPACRAGACCSAPQPARSRDRKSAVWGK